MALNVHAARAEALFASPIQAGDHPDRHEVGQAVAATVRHHGSRGCAARVAQEYGDHPESAAARMRWCLAEIDNAYPARRRR